MDSSGYFVIFATKLLQHHELCNRKCYLITHVGGNVLTISTLCLLLLTWIKNGITYD